MVSKDYLNNIKALITQLCFMFMWVKRVLTNDAHMIKYSIFIYNHVWIFISNGVVGKADCRIWLQYFEHVLNWPLECSVIPHEERC